MEKLPTFPDINPKVTYCSIVKKTIKCEWIILPNESICEVIKAVESQFNIEIEEKFIQP